MEWGVAFGRAFGTAVATLADRRVQGNLSVSAPRHVRARAQRDARVGGLASVNVRQTGHELPLVLRDEGVIAGDGGLVHVEDVPDADVEHDPRRLTHRLLEDTQSLLSVHNVVTLKRRRNGGSGVYLLRKLMRTSQIRSSVSVWGSSGLFACFRRGA